VERDQRMWSATTALSISLSAAAYTFDNGVTIGHPHESQLKRYSKAGVLRLHEPEEERWFIHMLFEAHADSILLNVGSAAGYYALLALRYRPPLAVVAVNPHPAFQKELAENAAAAGIAVVDAAGPRDPLAIPVEGGILQLGCALAERAQTGFMGGGYGSAIVRSAKEAVDLETSQARGALRHHTNSSRASELVGRVVPVQSVPLSDVFRCICPQARNNKNARFDPLVDLRGCAIYMATFDIQNFEEKVFSAEDTHALLRAHRIQRLLVGTHSPQAHGAVLEALSAAQYRILYNATVVEGQPDGLIVASSPNVRGSRQEGGRRGGIESEML